MPTRRGDGLCHHVDLSMACMGRVKRFDPDNPERDSVSEAGETIADPTVSVELAPVKPDVKVSRTRARAAANMRFNGASWEEIAEFHDFKDPATARTVVESHIAKAYPESSRESLFAVHAHRLEQLWSLTWAKSQPTVLRPNDWGEMVEVENPEQLSSIKVAADLVARSMRLHGLEAPTRVEITPDVEKFEDVVRRMTAHIRGDEAIEVDVVEYAEIDTVVEEGDLDD